MAEIIVEDREFTDRQSGIKTAYEYYAIKGEAADGNTYEVQLKNLVQSEKVALKMMANKKSDGEVRVATGGRVETKRTEGNLDLNDDDTSHGGLFDD